MKCTDSGKHGIIQFWKLIKVPADLESSGVFMSTSDRKFRIWCELTVDKALSKSSLKLR